MENTRALTLAVGRRKEGGRKDGMEGLEGGREEKQSLKTNRIKVKVDWRLSCLEPGKVSCDLTGPVLLSCERMVQEETTASE